MARKGLTSTYKKVVHTKRPNVHSKNRHTKQVSGKYYSGKMYRGQGR